MAKAPPAFQFYPADFVAGTLHLSHEAIAEFALAISRNVMGDSSAFNELSSDVCELVEHGWHEKVLRPYRQSKWHDLLGVSAFEWRDIRKSIIHRDKGVCQYCGKLPGGRVAVDHMVPLSRGGDSSVGNLCVACPKCNGSKGDLTPIEFITKSDDSIEGSHGGRLD